MAVPSWHLAVAVALAAGLLAACNGGGPDTADAGVKPDQATPAEAPYERAVFVDGAHAAASDTGPGTAAAPYKTIAAAMLNLRPGDDVIIAPGVYREGVIVPALDWGSAQTRLRAQTPHTVTIKGSIEVAGWAPLSAGVYCVGWTREEPQQVFRNGTALQQIGGTVFGGYPTNPPAELADTHAGDGGIWPGRVAGDLRSGGVDSFTYDAAAQRLCVRLAAAISPAQTLEVSVLRHTLRADNASALTIQGLDFAHASTSTAYRQGAVLVAGTNNVLRDLLVQDMDAACVQLAGTDNTLTASTLQRCGQLGLTARGTRLNITNNRITQGNTRGFNKWWEAGGMKLVGTDGVHQATVRNNVVAYNEGDGIWVDWKNTQNLIEGNVTAYNSGFGIQYEASQTGTIRGNLAYGNGMRGIHLLESSGTRIEGNAVFGNAQEGIAVADGTRSAQDPELRPTGNQVLGNAIAWNDINRNWVQLVLPGTGYGSASDKNAFKSVALAPRMSLGFVSNTNPAYPSLQAWRQSVSADLASTEQTLLMPDALNIALQARRLLQPSELPTFLANPGSY